MSAPKPSGITRRKLLERAALAGGALVLGGAGPAAGRVARRGPRGGTLAGMNVVLFITDQERAIQHFPPGWAQRNLPGATSLQRTGVTFERAFTDACMCSPARSTLMTGYFPAQHGVKYTLEEDIDNQYQVELPLDLPNIASVMASVGYDVVYKGKWHLSKPAAGGDDWAPSDVGKYGFTRWDPPDGGANQDIDQAGGGTTNHDGRYMDDDGPVEDGEEGVLAYLRSVAPQSPQPFFLIVSLVNPHDVLLYPRHFRQAGYDRSWLPGEIGLPATVDEDLSTKPTAQREFLEIFNLSGPLDNPARKLRYLNFYGNLMKSSDAYLVQVLDALRDTGLIDNTLVIKTSDHGEMGLTHNGMRQKNFNVYEESLRVPLVYSNRRLFRQPRASRALVSHADFLPTLAGLFGAPASARTDWEGVDYSETILGTAPEPPQDYIVFTYDDFQAGQASGPYVTPPNHVVSIREERWKIARYFDVNGRVPDQWELYDRATDPLERDNLGWYTAKRTRFQEHEFRRLQRKLARVEQTRLQPLS